MIKKLMLVSLIQLAAIFVFAQSTRVQIHGMQGQRWKGFIVHIDSNMLLMTDGWSKNYLYTTDYPVKNIAIQNIEQIRFKGKSNALKGFFIGAAAGTGIGLMYGASYDATAGLIDDEPAKTGQFTFNSALICGVAGALIGSASRKTLKKIFINGSNESFNIYRAELEAIRLP